MMGKSFLVVISGFLFTLSLLPSSPPLSPSTHKEAHSQELEDILQKAGNYCERLKSIALHFVCLEEVQEKIYHPYRSRGVWGGFGSQETNKYVYDYQLIRKGELIKESRILLKRDRKAVKEENAKLETQRFSYQYVIFGPTGLFSRFQQKRYNYSIEKEEMLWEKPALIVNANPKKPEESECLFGKAWLDPSDGSILKIEWEEASIEGYKAMREVAVAYETEPSLKFYSEYAFEKNGIRFPSQYAIKENYFNKKEATILEKSELIVEYKDYKFFVVETNVKYKK